MFNHVFDKHHDSLNVLFRKYYLIRTNEWSAATSRFGVPNCFTLGEWGLPGIAGALVIITHCCCGFCTQILRHFLMEPRMESSFFFLDNWTFPRCYFCLLTWCCLSLNLASITCSSMRASCVAIRDLGHRGCISGSALCGLCGKGSLLTPISPFSCWERG